jgi:hypothetical protein
LLTVAAGASDPRVRRRSLRDAGGELSLLARILQKGVRGGRIEVDGGLRLLDLGRGTRTLVRDAR